MRPATSDGVAVQVWKWPAGVGAGAASSGGPSPGPLYLRLVWVAMAGGANSPPDPSQSAIADDSTKPALRPRQRRGAPPTLLLTAALRMIAAWTDSHPGRSSGRRSRAPRKRRNSLRKVL